MKKNIREETIQMIQKIYEIYPCGGALHIVLDDGNVEDRHIHWCMVYAIPEIEDSEVRELFEKCAINLIKLDTERKRLSCISEAFNRMK